MAPSDSNLDPILAEQFAYYDAIAPEYEDHRLEAPGGDEIVAALDAFRPRGDVLELACGPGRWTGQLLNHASNVTAIDSSPTMLGIASSRIGEDRVRFLREDVFSWEPDRRYDVVFFGFLLSHVPPDRFFSFWELVDRALDPSGRVFFVDDGYRSPDEFIEGETIVVRRRLNNGSSFRIFKIEYEVRELEHELVRTGWNISVHQTSGPFYWGAGARM